MVRDRRTTSHGAVPLGDNPVDRLIRALNRIVEYQTPVRLTPAVDRFFNAQARDQTGPGKAWLSNAAAALDTKEGRAWLLSEPERNPMLRTTITPTGLRGRCYPTRKRSRSGERWSGSSPTGRSESSPSATR
jgi:hypothetical protein